MNDDKLKSFTTGLGSYVALGWMIPLAMNDSNVVFTLLAPIVLGWMSGIVAFYSIQAMYTMSLTLNGIMHGDTNHQNEQLLDLWLSMYSERVYGELMRDRMLTKP